MVRTRVGGSIATTRASSAWVVPSGPEEEQDRPLANADARRSQSRGELVGHQARRAIHEVAEAVLDHEGRSVGAVSGAGPSAMEMRSPRTDHPLIG